MESTNVELETGLSACLGSDYPAQLAEQYLQKHALSLLEATSPQLSEGLRRLARRIRLLSPSEERLAEKCHRLGAAMLLREPMAVLDQRLALAIHRLDASAALDCLERGADLSQVVAKSPEQTNLVGWLRNFREVDSCRVSELDTVALRLGGGYKAANLCVLRRFLQVAELQLEVLEVRVAKGIIIYHQETSSWLEQVIPGEVKRRWLEFVARGGVLDATGQLMLQTLKQQIEQAFADAGFANQRLTRWLAGIQAKYLIVRSTGREDSVDLSNAGGNTTVPFVEKHPKAIAVAIGMAIASYVSEKSVRQRMLAKDASLLKELPFMPVVIQEMITEPDPRKPCLRSGVLFSHDPQGDVNRTVIHSGLGLTDGLVSGRVRSDTYYVDRELKTHSVVRFKRQRTVKGSQELVEEEVGADEAQASALSEAQVRDLKRVSDALERFYRADGADYPLDVEFSIQGNVLYLFQSRPYMSSEPTEVTPTYLKLVSAPPALSSPAPSWAMDCQVLLPGGSEVKRIESAQHCLFADDGLEAIQACKPETRVVVLKLKCEEASHPGLVLKAAGVTVLVVGRPAERERLRAAVLGIRADRRLYVCPQRGRVVAGGKELDECLSEGRVSYPMKREATLIDYGAAPTDVDKRYEKLVASLGGVAPYAPGTNPRAWMELIAQGDVRRAESALAILLHLVRKTMAVQVRKATPAGARELLTVFNNFLHIAEGQLMPAIRSTEPQSMERLFPLRAMEALLYQEDTGEVVHALSLKSVFMRERNRKQWDGDPLRAVSMYAYAPKTALAWTQMIDELSPTDHASKQCLVELLSQLNSFSVLPLWLNGQFLPASETFRGPALVARLHGMLQADAQLLLEIDAHRTRMKMWRSNIGRWGQSASAVKLVEQFKADCTALHGNGQLKGIYGKAKNLGKLMLVGTLRECTDVLDLTIKEVLGSAVHTPNGKAHLVAELLEAMLRLMYAHVEIDIQFASDIRKVLKYLEKGAEFSKNPDKYNSDDTFNGIGFEALRRSALANTADPNALLAFRPEFDARPLVLGSQVALGYGVHMPRSLPEHHTVIHQNIVQMQLRLMSLLGLDANTLAPQPRELVTHIAKIIGRPVIAIDSVGGRVEAQILVPLRQHSCELRVNYDPNHLDSGLTLSLHAFGADEHDRWHHLACVGPLIAYHDPALLTLDSPPKLFADPSGRVHVVDWTIGISSKFAQLEKLVCALNWALGKMTTSHTETTTTIIREIGKQLPAPTGGYALDMLRHIPYMIPSLIQENIAKGKHHSASLVAAMGLIMLREQQMADWVRIDMVGMAGPKSLRFHAETALRTSWCERGIGHKARAMLSAAGVAMDFALEGETIDRVSVIEKYMAAGQFVGARDALEDWDNSHDLLEDLGPKIVEAEATAEAEAKAAAEAKAEAEAKAAAAKPQTLNMPVDAHDLMEKSAQAAKYLAQNGTDPVHALLLENAATVLMSYGVCRDSGWSTERFYGIDEYLDKPQYALIPNNGYKDTTKPYKAACGHMLRAYKSGSTELRGLATDILKKLHEFHKPLDQTRPRAQFLHRLIQAILAYAQ